MRMFNPVLFERRFGCGISPLVAPPESLEDALQRLPRRDPVEAEFPIPHFRHILSRIAQRRRMGRRRNESLGTRIEVGMRRRIQQIAAKARDQSFDWSRMQMLRRIWTANGFRERLSFFWADHFTAVGKTGLTLRAMSPYVESAIRPHMTGRFTDLLYTAVTHPLMLEYLDQHLSVGPDSRDLRASGDTTRGLNENLAREVLELHTLGVDGPYTQADVRSLARLFTGMRISVKKGFTFSPGLADPGPIAVLGRQYREAEDVSLRQVRRALDDLAMHPVTARHLARKLAVHFVSEDPDPGMVDAMADRYLANGGKLTALYRAMLEHPVAWSRDTVKIKHPFEYMTSCMRALAVRPAHLNAFSPRGIRQSFHVPLALMGQPWETPPGPNGWPEEASAWITPQGLCARIQWAMAMPASLCTELPDPQALLDAAFGPGAAPATVGFAAERALTRIEAVGLILSSPDFQSV